MKAVRYIMTAIAVMSVVGCFGFAAAAAPPESEWDGSSPLRNNRTYILSSALEIEESVVIPENTVLTMKNGSRLAVSDGVELVIEGGLNLQSGSTLFSKGSILVDESGTLSVYGSFETGLESSELEVNGLLDIQPLAEVKLYSRNVFGKSGIVTNGGQLLLERYSETVQEGALYIENGGKVTVGGRLDISEEGAFFSNGELAVERKGEVFVSGDMELREGSVLTASGRILRVDDGVIVDFAYHTDLSIYSSKPLKEEDPALLRGIDVSWVQGDIDWPAVAESGIDFVIIRAGRGDIDGTGPSMDTYFLQNIEGALENGLDVGVYFYSYALTPDDAETEARFFVSLLDGYEITYPVVMDFEEDLSEENIDDDVISEIAETFLEIVAEEGYYPMLYSYKARLDYVIDKAITEKYAIWVAQINNKQPDTEYDYYMWQYSYEGRINGINGNVDFDIAYRNFPEIMRYYGLNRLVTENEE